MTVQTVLAAYFDASAIVKLYVQDSSSLPVAEMYESLDIVACHDIGFVEVRASLAAAWRMKRLDDGNYTRQVSDFSSDWESVSTVSADQALLLRAAQLAEGFALCGYDSLHLASAERFRLGIPEIQFVAFDAALNRAARLLGFCCPEFLMHD